MTKKLIAALLFGASLSVAHAAIELVDRIIAVVGKDVVMLSELKSRAQENYSALAKRKPNALPSQEQVLTNTLDNLILEKLQLAEASKLGITASSDRVAEAMAQIAKNNKLTLDQLREALAKEGTSFDFFRNKIKNQLTLQRLIDKEVTNRIQVSDSEIDSLITAQDANAAKRREVRLFHILVRTPDGATADEAKAAAKKADKARKRIDAGESFEQVAIGTSDASNALQGGDVGWLAFAQLPRGYQEIVAKMNAGDVVGPFRSSNGFNILKAAEFRTPEDEVKMVIEYHSRHILVRTNELTSDDDAKTKLEQLKERIENGESFELIAKANSDDSSAIKGGDLDWMALNVAVPEFEEIMIKAPIGQITQPFKTRFGWHILEVIETRQVNQTEKIRKANARAQIAKRKSEEAKEEYLRRLRDEAFIDLRLDDLR
jgi:peptidyl-prolyl cis-trans isomerase SurA